MRKLVTKSEAHVSGGSAWHMPQAFAQPPPRDAGRRPRRTTPGMWRRGCGSASGQPNRRSLLSVLLKLLGFQAPHALCRSSRAWLGLRVSA